jgi:serine/threonine protein kinase
MTMLDITPQTRADTVVVGGRFLLGQRIGRVGVAERWLATDTLLQRPVAVHLLPERAPIPGLAAAIQAAARVNDPRLATVYDACYHQERPYLVSEWAGDPDLERLVLEAGLPGPGLAASIVAEAAEALASAHAHGRPHLRLELDSVHWGSSGLKITGLGIDAALTGMTSPAPAAADTVGLAGILYTLLTGYRPGAPADARHEPRELRREVPPMLNAIACHTLPAWGVPSIRHPAQLAAALRAAVPAPARY